MEKKCKKAKWLSERALEIAVKIREAKGNREKERYTHLIAEFQRIARKNKPSSVINAKLLLLLSHFSHVRLCATP